MLYLCQRNLNFVQKPKTKTIMSRISELWNYFYKAHTEITEITEIGADRKMFTGSGFATGAVTIAYSIVRLRTFFLQRG